MKILQVISYFYPAWSYGGPGKLVYEISGSLAAKGMDVAVYTTDAYSQQRRRSADDNLSLKNEKFEIVFFRNLSNYIAYKYKIFLTIGCMFRLMKEIKTFDVIHIHEFFTILAVFSSVLAKYHGVPYFISAHGTLNKFHLGHRKSLKGIFMAVLGKWIIENCSKFVAATDEEIIEYRKLNIQKAKIILIQNGIKLEMFTKLPRYGHFRNKYGILKNDFIILFLGRIHKLKGLANLITAFKKVYDKKIKLIIAGSDDGYMDTLIKLIKDGRMTKNVLLPGVSYGIHKMEMYKDADAFIYPSPSEGFSIAILEAGAAGLPLFITKGCKFPQVEKYHAGYIFESDSESIYKGLKKMIKSKEYCKKMGKNAKKMIMENYSIDLMTDKLMNSYSAIN